MSSLDSAKSFFQALEQHDLTIVEPLLAPDVVEVIPLAFNGRPAPQAVHTGKGDVMKYLTTIVTNFSKTVMGDQEWVVSESGDTVFMEGKGDLRQAGTDIPYNNVYVFKFEFVDGKITRIMEYANPIPIAALLGAPIG